MPDRSTPKRLTGEKETLLDFLDYLRESVILKVDGLDQEAARRSSVPSGTSLLGLVKHLTTVEAVWFQFAFAGRTDTVPGDEVEPPDTVTTAVAAYRNAIQVSNDIVGACNDLDHLCARAPTTPQPLSLRWLLVHMVEETARHAGHADILREQIDGQTGR
ncbi:MAG: DinB family protein [Acidimicrobiales bacterium]